MRNILITTLATVAIAGISTTALADAMPPACHFKGPLGDTGVKVQDLLNDATLAQKGVGTVTGIGKNGKSSAPAICAKAGALLQFLSKGSYTVSVNTQYAPATAKHPNTMARLQSTFCDSTTPLQAQGNPDNGTSTGSTNASLPLSPTDQQNLAKYTYALNEIIDDCNNINYANQVFSGSGAQKASTQSWNNNPFNPNGVADTHPHQPVPQVKWQNPPKNTVNTNSITTTHPNAGNDVTGNRPAPFTPNTNNPKPAPAPSNVGNRFFN